MRTENILNIVLSFHQSCLHNHQPLTSSLLSMRHMRAELLSGSVSVFHYNFVSIEYTKPQWSPCNSLYSVWPNNRQVTITIRLNKIIQIQRYVDRFASWQNRVPQKISHKKPDVNVGIMSNLRRLFYRPILCALSLSPSLLVRKTFRFIFFVDFGSTVPRLCTTPCNSLKVEKQFECLAKRKRCRCVSVCVRVYVYSFDNFKDIGRARTFAQGMGKDTGCCCRCRLRRIHQRKKIHLTKLRRK